MITYGFADDAVVEFADRRHFGGGPVKKASGRRDVVAG